MLAVRVLEFAYEFDRRLKSRISMDSGHDRDRDVLQVSNAGKEPRQTPRCPAVYRWSVSTEVDGQSMIYVGETGSLRRRVNNYLKMHGPGQKTNVRLFEMFSKFVAKNKEVTLDVLSFQKFTVSVSTITEERLEQKWVRLLLEGLMVAHSISPECKVLNLSVDP